MRDAFSVRRVYELDGLVHAPQRQRRDRIAAGGIAPGKRRDRIAAGGIAPGRLGASRAWEGRVMPQSLSQVFVHIVFSTKNRHPWLPAELRPRVHGFLAAIARKEGAEVYRVGGVEDHVHLAVRLPRTVALADLLEAI